MVLSLEYFYGRPHIGANAELSMGWVDPWIGLGWVEIFQFLVGLVGLGPLQDKY